MYPTGCRGLDADRERRGQLSRKVVKNGSFTSPRQLRDAIDRFVSAYNKDAQPFAWIKKKVYPKSFKTSYANLPD